MIRVTEYRANRILYNFIKSNSICGTAIVPANVCQSVVDTLLFSGMDLLFVDISKETLCVDEQAVIANVQTAALILFVHTYGVEMGCPGWFSVAKRLNPSIVIVDDRCLCLPQLTISDTVADLVLYSFCPKKQVDLGIGSIGYVADRWMYDSFFVDENPYLMNLKWTPDFMQIEERIHQIESHKRRLNEIYRSSLPPEIQLNARYQNWRFNILVSNQDKILKSLFDAGLFASRHYHSLSLSCPIALALQDRVINLFNDFYYTEEQAQRTCEIVGGLIIE